VVKNKKTKGFTLIELMLATSLLMLVMFSGYYAYSLYTQKWQKRVQVFWQGTKQSIAINTLNKMLISINSYVINGLNDKECIYFSGSSNTMQFVTGYPIYSKGSALVELTVKDVDGSYQLIYKEHSVDNLILFNLDNINADIKWEKQTVLLSNLKDIHWSYYGWTSFSDALAQSNIVEGFNKKDTRQEYSDHDTNKVRILPINIRFTIVTQDSKKNSDWLIELPNNTLYKLISDIRVDA